MKLHKISLCNLNSLYGEHEVDLHNDLHHAPLFLIVGQTGSGKSTILDAICLALFGQTPRLPKTPGKPDTTPGLIMSHGTGSCSASVEFSKREADGVRRTYRAEWSCRRSRNKPNGNLQNPERSLTLIHDGGFEELLISDGRIKKTQPYFDEVLEGLSVDDFQRSVLLAQGQFAAFLQASENEKASILERLTNTDEYKQIGKRAAHRYKLVSKEYEKLQQQLGGLSLLSAEDEQNLRNEFNVQRDLLAQVQQQLEDTQAVTLWLQERHKLQQAWDQAKDTKTRQQEEWAERQVELERLREHERCQSAAPALARVQTLECELQQLEQDVPALTQKCEQAEQAFQSYTAAHKDAEEALQVAQQAMEEARPTLDEAHGRAAVLEKNRDRLAHFSKQEKTQKATLKKKQKAHQQADTELQAAQELATQAQTALAEVEHLRSLGEVVLALESETNHVLEQANLLEKAVKKQDSLRQKLDELQRKQQKLQTDRAELQASFTPQREVHEQAVVALQEALGDIEDVRTFRTTQQERREQTQALVRATDEAISLHQSLVELLQKLDVARKVEATRREELQQKQSEREQVETSYQDKVALSEEQAASLQVLERALALTDHRSNLEAGTPCPLCGSPEHPYRDGRSLDEAEAQFIADRDALQGRIKKTKQESTKLQKQLGQLDKDIVRCEESVSQHVATQESLQASFLQTERSWIDALTRASCDAPDSFPTTQEILQQDLLAQWQQQRDLYQETVEQIQASLASVEELQKAVEDTEVAWKKAQQKDAKLEVEAAKLEEKLQLQETQIQEAESAITEQRQRKQQQASTLQERFTKAGVEVPVLSEVGDDRDAAFDFPAALETAQAQKQRFEQAEQQHSQAQQKLQACVRKLQEARQACEELQRTLDSLLKEKATLEQEIETLEKAQDALLQGETLQALQERLEQAITAAKQTEEKQRKAREKAQEKHHHLQAEWNERQRALSTRREALEPAQTTLQEALAALALDSRAQLEGHLLEPDVYRDLRSELDLLKRELEQAELQVHSTQKALEKHASQRPNMANVDEQSLEEWQAQTTAYKEQVAEEAEKVGVLREQIKQMEVAQKRAAGLREELEEAQKIRNIWKSINDLIGVRDGDSFKLFAQSLNLQELVVRANDRLRRLAPRYRLAVATGESGEPLLNFVVRDREQAEDERPITTLSGGETFLVSLALALALADFRRIEMPIETLLLDEGFGTLDQDTLDIVMQTLRQLQQENDQQIALISHVEALKERIDAQVIVEKLGNGRSSIRVSAPVIGERTAL